MFKFDPYTGKPIPQRTGYNWGWEPQEAYQQAQQQQEPSTPWTMVPCLADVDKVSVQPGETKWIMVQSDPIFAVKTANAMGYAPAEYYRFEQIDPAVLAAPAAVQASQQLTRADVEKIVEDKAQALISQYGAALALQAPAQTSAKAKKEVAHE